MNEGTDKEILNYEVEFVIPQAVCFRIIVLVVSVSSAFITRIHN